MKYTEIILIFLLGMVLGGLIWIPFGNSMARFAEQQAAIKANVGQFVINPTTGESSFVYGVSPSKSDASK